MSHPFKIIASNWKFFARIKIENSELGLVLIHSNQESKNVITKKDLLQLIQAGPMARITREGMDTL